jgi:pilus assembly protein FimV
VVEQRSDFQYSDDDLTIDKLDSEPLDPGVVDLFDYLDDDSSPISRLKALVLSIDWEINDDVLRDFNEELISLRDIWGGDPIKVVYLQALEKITKYIYRARSDAHPDAIKLLPKLFVDLEKIVQGGRRMSEDEKKRLLVEDVRHFERLKAQIQARHPSQIAASHEPARAARQTTDGAGGVMAIHRLKALILGIDWEITEKDLMALRREVLQLEEIFASSRPKQLFLQGIGTLSAYIRNKKSNAHADAFSLLHNFFVGLEKVVTEGLDFPAEKAVLLPLVARFNVFKTTIASTLSADAIAKSKQAVLEEEAGDEYAAGPLQPAFADLPDDVHGFHLEEEAISPDVPQAVVADIENFFTEEDGPPLASVVDEMGLRDPANDIENLLNQPAAAPVAVAPEVALRGINVETDADDDSGEAALPLQGGQLAPALSDEPALPYGESGSVGQTFPIESEIPEEISNRLDDFFSTPQMPPAVPALGAVGEIETAAFVTVSSDVALQGANVEMDGDDEKYEGAPTLAGGDSREEDREPAPALADVDAPELSLDEDEVDVEFSVASESESVVLSASSDDEPDEFDDAATSDELAPALSGFADAELPERSEFAEEEAGEKGDDVLALESGELLSFFDDQSAAGEMEIASSGHVGKSAVQVESSLDDAPRRLDDEPQQDDLVAFLADDENPAEEMTSSMSEEHDEENETGPIAFLADDVPAPVNSTFGSDSDTESERSALDATDQFINDFFADKTEESLSSAETTPELDLRGIPGVDVGDEIAPVSRHGFAEIPGIDADDEIAPVAALSEAGPGIAPTTPLRAETSLRDCVDALSDEINDDILEQSYREVSRLRAELGGQPLAGMYLQFISTIMQHIDRRRADASDAALPLLRQTLAHLEESQQNGETGEIERSLLGDTQAVLSWQQSLFPDNGAAARVWL